MSFSNITNAQDGSDVYILKTGPEAEKVLEEQHKIFEQDSHEHLKKAGLSSGQIVWDIGCGSGMITEYLAKTVGESGHVYALDISPDQIDIAKKRIEKAKLKNVTFVQGDVYSLKHTSFNPADIVYTRFVLMHLTNPEEALIQIYNLLKPSGVLASQESIMETGCASIKCPDLENYTTTLVALGVHKGVDFNIGNKLQDLCARTSFEKVDAYFIQHKLTPQQMGFILLKRLEEWGDKAIQADLATLQDIQRWKIAIEKFSKYQAPVYYSTPKQAYILAWR